MSKETLEMIQSENYDTFYESFSAFIDRRAREELVGEKKKDYKEEEEEDDDDMDDDDKSKDMDKKKDKDDKDKE